MKKLLLWVLLCGTAFRGFTQETAPLDETLQDITVYMTERIPSGAKIVILNVQSDYADLSNYIIDELTAHLVNTGALTVVDRQNLELLRQEMDFQLSGEVSDESAQAIGQKLGAQTIVSGAIAPLGDMYRLRIRAIAVETAAIQGIQNRNVEMDSTLAALIKRPYRGPSRAFSGNTEAGDFSLDGRNVFAISANGMVGSGFGAGGMITVFETYKPGWFATPSIFVSTKYFADFDDRKRFFAGGAGVLFKRRLTRRERLLLNLGFSLEYLAGHAEEEGEEDYYGRTVLYSGDINVLGMGIQGGISFRLTPKVSLDLNGLVKFGFGPVKLKQDYSWCYPATHDYTPVTGGVEAGITIMFPY